MIPAPPSRFAELLPLLRAPGFNVYFARAVLEGRNQGTVYVDETERPRAAYILHPCGMSLICGFPCAESFKDALVDHMLDTGRVRGSAELAQALPDAWHGTLSERLGPRLLGFADPRRTGLDPAAVQRLGEGRVVEWRRLNYEFDRASFEAMAGAPLQEGLRLERAGGDVFGPWQGTVLPRFFWDNPGAFMRDGVAFAVYEGARPLCVAFSAWVFDDALEIGIETRPEARGRGLAKAACAMLIRHALARGLQPVWSSHIANQASLALASSLGFRVTRQLPYYRLVEGRV